VKRLFGMLTANQATRGDVRVLKAQLDLAARSVRATRISSPLWALALAIFCSDQAGFLGHRPLTHTLLLPLMVLAVNAAAVAMTARYQKQMAHHPDTGIATWYRRYCILQLAASTAWGTMPWLLWDDGNVINHLFLACCSMAVGSALLLARGGNMTRFVCALAPICLMVTARFALGNSNLDYAIAVAAPFFGLHLWLIGRPLIVQMQQDTLLRFKVEDLARELEETRDEALKKRFEAETANASKTAFLANMSHELRTPLNAILGFSEIIAQECFGPVSNERYKDYAGDIHSSGAHLLSLINDLLDIAKIEAGRMEISPHPLDARRTLEIALKLAGMKASERHQVLTIEVEPSCPPLFADERALRQILINLVSNAVKFTPPGGRIEVVASAARDGGFQIMVRDNGPGIPHEKLDTIFTPFSQVDNRYDRQGGGTGLGLALVRGLTELHGGRAWIESQEGAGCCAFVVLPVKAPARVAAFA
jgi:two-component system, cell cycle sensor histidine kinase PleC